MTLAPGTRVGVYDIDSLLGAGGPPPFALVAHSANYGEVSPKPSTRTRRE